MKGQGGLRMGGGMPSTTPFLKNEHIKGILDRFCVTVGFIFLCFYLREKVSY